MQRGQALMAKLFLENAQHAGKRTLVPWSGKHLLGRGASAGRKLPSASPQGFNMLQQAFNRASPQGFSLCPHHDVTP